jgi:hypothetical protein
LILKRTLGAHAGRAREGISVGTVFFVHLTTDTLEEYAFNRLSEAETEALEEHLLVCPTCQTSLAEVDEYIFLMREATAAYQPATSPKGGERTAWLKTALMGYAAGAIALAATLFLILASRPGPLTEEASPVTLSALRGPSMNHARAGRPLELTLDTTGLTTAGALTIGGSAAGVDSTGGGPAGATSYRIEVIDAGGKPVWSGQVAACKKTQSDGSCEASGGPISARVPGGLKAGVYWVRLYAGGELLREFGLQAN